jgi:hypothetical protein
LLVSGSIFNSTDACHSSELLTSQIKSFHMSLILPHLSMKWCTYCGMQGHSASECTKRVMWRLA